MSWDVTLTDPSTGEALHATGVHHFSGGTYAMGGTTELWLNVTFNYSATIRRTLGMSLWELEGKTAGETVTALLAACALLEQEARAEAQVAGTVTADYWQATAENVRRALAALVAFAELYPTGVWRVR